MRWYVGIPTPCTWRFTHHTSNTFLRVASTAQSSYTPLHGDLPTSHPLDKILRERLAILQAPFVPS